jgi:hypothetical protein
MKARAKTQEELRLDGIRYVLLSSKHCNALIPFSTNKKLEDLRARIEVMKTEERRLYHKTKTLEK